MSIHDFENNLPLESVLSRATRDKVNADTRVSAVTGESAAAFFPAEGENYPVNGGSYRAAGEEGATQGTADGLNTHPDDRQGKDAASVPDEVLGSNADGDADDDGEPDA
jgi:hypothetical protein